MRRYALLLIVIALIAAGCGAQQPTAAPPTADAGGPTATSASIATPAGPVAGFTQPVDQALDMTGMATPPPAGTAVVAAANTPDPLASIQFTSITFLQTGGSSDARILIVLKGDGTFTRNDVPGSISADQVAMIDDYLNQINFFRISGTFTSANVRPDQHTYSVLVEKDGASATINMQDGLVPPELARLLAMLSTLGASA
ncbi:MAG TPA: hypothetical protein PLQ56_06270 [Aggregatilineales bacterium]|nr:hypothetical protein [Aggregatilineales bacterium]